MRRRPSTRLSSVLLTVFAILAAGPAVGPAVGAQSLPTPAALVARHDSIVGGRAVLAAHQSMRLIGSFTLAAAGIEAPLEILKVRPNKYIFRSSFGSMGEVMQGFDGTTAWAIQPGVGPVLLTGAQAEQIAEQADFFGDLHDLSRFSSAETVGEETFEGRRTYKVRMVRPNGDIVHEFFDAATGLSAGGSATVPGPTGLIEHVSVFSDYKVFDGLGMATRVVQRQPQFEVVLSIVAVEFDSVDERAVALPEAVRALLPAPDGRRP
ncbi:MAG: hypothetical protein WD771_04550 [Gemmatimonadaceae bacterium]